MTTRLTKTAPTVALNDYTLKTRENQPFWCRFLHPIGRYCRPPPCWIFKISGFSTFRHVASPVLERCTKVGLNISLIVRQIEALSFPTFVRWLHLN